MTDGSLISPSSCSPTILSPTEASEQSSIEEASCQDVPSYPSPSSREIPTEVEVGASFAGKPTEDYYYFYQGKIEIDKLLRIPLDFHMYLPHKITN